MKAPHLCRYLGAIVLALAAGWGHAGPLLEASQFAGLTLPEDTKPIIIDRPEPLVVTFVSAGEAYFRNTLFLFDGSRYFEVFNNKETTPGTSVSLTDYALGTALHFFLAPSSPEWGLMGLYHLGETDPVGPGGVARVLVDHDASTGKLWANFEDYPFDPTDVWGCSGREVLPAYSLPEAFDCEYIAREIASGTVNYGHGDMEFTLHYEAASPPAGVPIPGVPLLILTGIAGLITSRRFARRDWDR